VGDFVFLTIRTRTANMNVLNRERTPTYKLDVRAKVRGKGARKKSKKDKKTRTPDAREGG
jgi:hypothetical protein